MEKIEIKNLFVLPLLGLESIEDVKHQLINSNLFRIKISIPILISVHLLHVLIFTFELESYTGTILLWRKGIVMVHLIAFFYSLFIGIYLLLSITINYFSYKYIEFLAPVSVAFYLFFAIATTIIDKYVTTSITPYIIASIGLAFLILLRPYVSIIIYTIGYSCFSYFYFTGMEDPNLVLSIQINIVTIQSLSIIASIVFWKISISGFRQVKIINNQNEILGEKNKQLLQLSKEKDEFLAIASHDLKNPISTISGISDQLLEAKHLNENEMKYIQEIKETTRRMHQLIIDLLDVNKLEMNVLQANREFTNLIGLCTTVVNNFKVLAKQKNQSINLNFSQDKVFILTDSYMLIEILENLVSNALKFSPPSSSVELKVSLIENSVEISVIDSGPGLEVEDQSQLFHKFKRLTPTPTGGEHSTGLGLFICKKLIVLLGGTIDYKRIQPKGSIFSLRFPYDPTLTLKNENDLNISEIEWDEFLDSLNVLIIEDDLLMNRILVHLLQKIGLNCESAISGEEAIQKAQKTNFNIVFTDLNMPNMGGYEVSDKIQRLYKHKIYLVLNSSDHIDSKDLEKYSIFAFLDKPVNEFKIRQILNKIFIDKGWTKT